MDSVQALNRPSGGEDHQTRSRPSDKTIREVGDGKDETDTSVSLPGYSEDFLSSMIKHGQREEYPERVSTVIEAPRDLSDHWFRNSLATAQTHISTPPSQKQRESGVRHSKVSTVLSWRTARSFVSRNSSSIRESFHSANSGILGIAPPLTEPMPNNSWMEYMRSLKLLVEPELEQDWSGRGQHAEFNSESEVPLQVEAVLGFGTALVESVRCRRIRLARKTINCSYRLKKEDAVKEVAHLQRLKHTHIIQVVGTYICGRKFSILLYPVAEYTLDVFMDEVRQESRNFLDADEQQPSEKQESFETFFSCLAKAMDFIHKNLVKHMDIKPKNILVKRNSENMSRRLSTSRVFKIIVADFGISRSYTSVAEVCTESPTSFTRTYAAPEVIDQAPRDFSADMFSLGCIYVEMLTTLESLPLRKHILPWTKGPWKIFSKNWLHDFEKKVFRGGRPISKEGPIPSYNGLVFIRQMNTSCDASYQANAKTIIEWLWHRPASEEVPLPAECRLDVFQVWNFTDLVCGMLNEKPGLRPSSSRLDRFFNCQAVFPTCDCGPAPDPYEAADG